MKTLSTSEAAKRLGIKQSTLRNRLSRGDEMPPSMKVNGKRLFPEKEFNEWMIAHLIDAARLREEKKC